MKNIAVIIIVGLIVVVMGLMCVAFQVRETETCIVTRLGKAKEPITEPGLKFKWPAPIETVHKFDSRMRVFEDVLGETTTKGAVPIIVNTYVIWRIEDPLKFYNAIGTVDEAKEKLRSQISDAQNTVIGKYEFSQFVNSDTSKIQLEQIQKDMLENLQANVSKDYGIKIVSIGIKQLKVNEEVTKDVFARMKAERNSRTQILAAQGNAEATRIRTEADTKKTELLAAAQARAKAIKGQGDADAAGYYKLLEEDPDLAMFLRDIDALKSILEKRATVVLSADTEPFKLLKGMPKIEPKK